MGGWLRLQIRRRDRPTRSRRAADRDRNRREATRRLDIKSTRPVGLGRLFIGRSAADAPALATRLFGRCGFSHAAASRLAIAAARGAQTDPGQTAAIALGLAGEQTAELLRATTLGWPRADGPADLAPLAGPLREVLGTSRELISAAERQTLPEGTDPLARLVAAAVAEGEGFADVETARGRLYHRARLDKSDRIVDYGFVAPTEWNFHRNGPLAATLLGAELGPTARLDIERLASVFDPCVPFETELRETADA